MLCGLNCDHNSDWCVGHSRVTGREMGEKRCELCPLGKSKQLAAAPYQNACKKETIDMYLSKSTRYIGGGGKKGTRTKKRLYFGLREAELRWGEGERY